MSIPRNTLAQRYASEAMLGIWSEEQVVRDERQLWTRSLDVQASLGVQLPEGAIDSYRRHVSDIDFDSIAEREKVTNHDVVARRDEFDEIAGYKLAHRPFTSRDDTDNMEQLRILTSLKHVRNRSIAVLARLRWRTQMWQNIAVCGRSHRQPGQVTTYGKRVATIAEEFMVALRALETLIEGYTFRGFKGAMGTQQDLIAHLGSIEKAHDFENTLCSLLHMRNVFDSVGQIYPRSLDFQVVSVLYQLAAAPSNFARLVRDAAELRHMGEGFAPGRKGSSAMPHKKNPSKSERIQSLKRVMIGHLTTAASLVGEQEFEGDVSCSVARRVMLADCFYAIDGIFETILTVLDQMDIYEKVIQKELDFELPFLSTTAIRVASVRRGADDEVVYDCIQKHSLAASEEIQDGGHNTLLERLAADKNIPFSLEELEKLCVPDHGDAVGQTGRVIKKINDILQGADDALLSYQPETRN